MAAAAVSAEADVIVACGATATLAARKATSTIPIVMVIGMRRLAALWNSISAGQTASLKVLERASQRLGIAVQGAKPAELAIEQPTKFELAVNLKTAKALGLAIPRGVLIRADEVVQ